MFNTKSAPMTSAQVQNSTEVNKVYKTSDLTIFTQIEGNRVPNLQHVKRLSASVKQYGMKCNPILVNERMEVIDGQHRLMAAREVGGIIYYIKIDGYSLSEVHTLNLNQKNWTKKDFMDGYANMGVLSYIKLKKFHELNDDYSFTDCISLCSNLLSGRSSFGLAEKSRSSSTIEVFEEGTWIGKDFNLAQDWANKIRLIKPYYSGYNRSTFLTTMIGLFQNDKFDFSEFMHKVRLQPTALVDCSNRDQYRTLIEDIYNWRSRSKVNLKY